MGKNILIVNDRQLRILAESLSNYKSLSYMMADYYKLIIKNEKMSEQAKKEYTDKRVRALNDYHQVLDLLRQIDMGVKYGVYVGEDHGAN